MNGQETAALALRQVKEGLDIPPIASVLGRVTPSQAALLPEGFKYSLLTLVEHARFWQRIWLDRLEGNRPRSFTEDWRIPDSAEWGGVRRSFLADLDRAVEISLSKPFHHLAKSDGDAQDLLLRIAVHNAYHVGQFVLLKRAIQRR